MVESEKDYEYKFLGTVSGFGALEPAEAGSENAMNKVRNKAAAVGANAIHILHMPTTIQDTSVTAETPVVKFDANEN